MSYNDAIFMSYNDSYRIFMTLFLLYKTLYKSS